MGLPWVGDRGNEVAKSIFIPNAAALGVLGNRCQGSRMEMHGCEGCIDSGFNH